MSAVIVLYILNFNFIARKCKGIRSSLENLSHTHITICKEFAKVSMNH